MSWPRTLIHQDTGPRPRNPALADAFKRIGLVERAGRGESIIYMGQLRSGRLAPRYDRSTDVSVTVVLDSGPADLDFVLLVIRANRRLDRTLNVDDLLALWEVRRRGAVNAHTLAPLLQRGVSHAATVLENLVASGLLRAEGQVYRLYSDLGAVMSHPAKPIPPDPEAAVLNYVRTHGSISRREVFQPWDLSENQAAYLLRKFVEQGELQMVGRGPATRYKLGKSRNKLGNSRSLDPHSCDRFRKEHQPIPRLGRPPRLQRWLAGALPPRIRCCPPTAHQTAKHRPRQPRRPFTASPASGLRYPRWGGDGEAVQPEKC